ncbi:hypothetical protein [Streptomyces sp. NPDC053431]|uniref:hypothetical protein n=1 Tax=Streptomyces sp. NPDC053431 TaxID=3365703 RepID=UPI0037CFF45A
MRGDETQSAGTTRGPRHAAPRKSLLNKLQVPAGKAMALAAMPTAVLMGMGLAPRLALADDSKDIPFAPGPCVTRSDEPTAEATTKPARTESPEPTASATEKPAPETSATAEPKPTATTGAERQQAATQAPAPQATTAAPQPTPTPTKSVNPLDPLGLGDALKDLFDGPNATTPAPQPSSTTAAPRPTAGTGTPDAPKETTAPRTGTGGTTGGTVDKTKDAIKSAAATAGAATKELPDSAKGLDAKKDEDIPDGAKPRFPCPEADPKALAAAELESGMPLLPDEPWILQTSKLELRGLKYHGIVEVKTGSGKIKKVLKFTADEVDITNLHQLTVHSDGLTGHVRSRPGSMSTMRNGTVTMYTEELKGNLFGLIPVTFSPATPPPLDVPWAIFTSCTVKQAGQFGGTLRIPGLENTIEPS